jgi:hypothetical protein
MSHDPNDCYDFDGADQPQENAVAKRLREADAYNKKHNVRDPLHLEAAAELDRLQRERDYSVTWANRSVDQVKEGIGELEDLIKELLSGLKRTASALRRYEADVSGEGEQPIAHRDMMAFVDATIAKTEGRS